MRSSKRNADRRAMFMSLASGCVLLVGVGLVRAGQGGAPPPAQPVTLPHKDLLEAGGAAEAEQPIQRPPESEQAGAIGKPGASSDPADAKDTKAIGRQSTGRGFWQASDFLPLFAVLALVALAAWAVKKYLPARRLVSGTGVMEIVARLPLNPKQSLVLVKMGQRMVLVGLSPERVNTVCLVDDPEEVANLTGRIASYARDASDREFGQSLDQQAETYTSGDDDETPLQAAGGVRGLLEKVRRLSRSGVNC